MSVGKGVWESGRQGCGRGVGRLYGERQARMSGEEWTGV